MVRTPALLSVHVRLSPHEPPLSRSPIKVTLIAPNLSVKAFRSLLLTWQMVLDEKSSPSGSFQVSAAGSA